MSRKRVVKVEEKARNNDKSIKVSIIFCISQKKVVNLHANLCK